MRGVVGPGRRRLVSALAVVAVACGGWAGQASATITNDPGWPQPLATVSGTGAIAFSPRWTCMTNCVMTGQQTRFTATALGGATFTPEAGNGLKATGAAVASCTVTASEIDCVNSTNTILTSAGVGPVTPFTLNVPPATADGTPLVRLGWSDPGGATKNDPSNDSQTILLANGPFGDWGDTSATSVQMPGIHAGPIDVSCLSFACEYRPSGSFTASMLNGTRLLDSVGSTRYATIDGAPVGSCTVASETSLACALTASGMVVAGKRIRVPQIHYDIPAGTPDGAPVVEIAWSSGGIAGDDPANDIHTVHASTGGAFAPQDPTVAFGEDFEHGQGSEPILVTDYVGAPPLGQTYRAAAAWLRDCNGIISSSSTRSGA